MTFFEVVQKTLQFDIFPFLCRLIASALLLIGVYSIGFPVEKSVNPTAIALLVFSAFFVLVPIVKKISLGRLLSFEREVEKVKEEVRGFKTETRESLAVYSNMITAISNTVNNSVTVNLPGQAETQQAKDDLDASIETPEEPSSLERSIASFVNEAGGDYDYALARLRMDLERTLRELLGRHTFAADSNGTKSKFLSARQLFKQFTSEYAQYRTMHGSFDYILKICNAAIHGQEVSEEYAHEAIYMGIRMIEEIGGIGEKMS